MEGTFEWLFARSSVGCLVQVTNKVQNLTKLPQSQIAEFKLCDDQKRKTHNLLLFLLRSFGQGLYEWQKVSSSHVWSQNFRNNKTLIEDIS